MLWQEIREHYPQQWLLVEAIKAHTEGDKRMLEMLAVVSSFADSASAMNAYIQLHREKPEKELYVVHSSKDRLDISERKWLGVRAAT